ncbi:MAG: T9SS type A sorting domain-containing protein [Bacteroidota bacterium]
MKTFYVRQSLLMFLLLALSPFIAIGQGDKNNGNTGGGNGSGNDCTRCLAIDHDPGTGWLYYDGCNINLRVRVTVANLNQGEAIKDNFIYQLPSGYPLLYLEHSINGSQGINLVNAFRFSHYAQTAGGTVPMFEQFVNISFDVASLCQENPGGFNPEILLKLVTYDALNNIILYPVHLYSGEDDIFSCLVFVETCNYCNNSLEVCPPNSGLPIYPVDEFIDCEECNAGLREDNGGEYERRDLPEQLSASPNPFRDVIDVQYQFAGDKAAQIDLMDVNGRLVYQRSIAPGDRQSRLSIDASHLANGVYYCRMTTASSQKVIRLIKMN